MARLLPLYTPTSQAEIERLAQELFERNGRPTNRALDHWLSAEEQFLKTLPAFESDAAVPDRVMLDAPSGCSCTLERNSS